MGNVVITGAEIAQGKKVKDRKTGAVVQPLQFLPRDEKDEDWNKDNADFIELQSLRQIIRKAPRLSKNYNLAAGIIDKTDYVGGTTPENKQLLETLLSPETESHSAMDIEFYPIIPTFVNTMANEYAKRHTKMMFQTNDDYSYNEMLALKYDEISNVLLKQAEQKLTEKLIASGANPDDPEDAKLFEQELSPEKLKTLPEIEHYFNTSYRSMVIEWASHQHEADYLRFHMDELEQRNFRNSIITDEAYFHYLMMEDDYEIEIWNPMFTAIFKAPENRYASSAYAACNVKLGTVADVINKFGYIMDEDQITSLERIYPQTNALYPITGYDKETYYDKSKSIEENNEFSLAMKQNASMLQNEGTDVLSLLMNQSASSTMGNDFLLRISTMYWVSQRRVGHLTDVRENGQIVTMIVDESYVVTRHPLYNNTLIENRNVDTLIYGEHIDWTWIPEARGIVKIGPNTPTYAGLTTNLGATSLQPIYLGINQNKPDPLKYQFKGENSLYGSKLPVEGARFSDYNTRSTTPVNLLEPFQIGYNVVNNQIKDILIDELGTIVALDPNQLPKHSLGEEWGDGNYAKGYLAMRNFSILPLDRRLSNTEGAASSGAPTQVLNLEQSARLQSRINLAIYFKNEGLSTLGITPQRLGQPTGRQTATGVEENLNASYNQTENYFTQYTDFLLPRVYQQMLDLAQYYQSKKPSVRLQYVTSKGEKVNFQINGNDLLLRDINVFCVSTATNRNIMEELRKLLITNNTAGGTIYELGQLLTADSVGEINNILQGIQKRAQDQRQQELSQEQALQKQKEDAELKAKQLQWDYEARQAELGRQRDIIVAEIRAAGYSGSVDLDQNQQNDFMDNLKIIQGQEQFHSAMSFDREKEANKNNINRDKMNLEREKMTNQERLKNIDLQIARENQTKSELEAKKKLDKKKKEAAKKK